MLKKTASRILELDLIRGFFVLIIVIDHFQRWPNIFTFMTGEGRLWVTAAEGFFIVSGLLIGYIRGRRSLKKPLKEVTKTLLKRSATLYVWCIIITCITTVAAAFLSTPDKADLFPKLPEANVIASLPAFFTNVLSLNFASDWIYFLRLYAIMLAISPLVIWAFRRGKWYLVAAGSLAIFTFTELIGFEEAACQWQLLFFGAALIGWKFDDLLAILQRYRRHTRRYLIIFSALMLAVFGISYFFVHGWTVAEDVDFVSYNSFVTLHDIAAQTFNNSPMTIWRIALAFGCFGGLMSLFHLIKPWLMRWFSWLLVSFGTNSLTVYCLQALILPLIQFIAPVTDSWVLNTLMTSAVVMIIWLTMRIPFVTKILPK